ncbi:MAG: hypothetical protein JWO03_1437 [Bacteroidetes bacterium]|nr:hypothetical protein [Bacteroidota bacterium]
MSEEKEISYEEYKALDIEVLKINPPISGNPQLPLAELSWEMFERLCVLLAEEIWGNARIYLGPGHKQEGIDIYTVEDTTTGQFPIFIQCKKRQKPFTKRELAKTVRDFLKGRFNRPNSKFIICVANELDKDGPDSLLEQSSKLLSLNIQFEVWDVTRLRSRLREHPQVVYDIFDRDDHALWTQKICGTLANQVTKKYLPLQNKIPLKKIDNYIRRVVYTNESDKAINHQYLLNTKQYVLLDLIKSRESKRIFLLSDAGSGKTTAIKQLASELSETTLPFLPIVCDLKNYDGENLDSFIKFYLKDLDKYDPNNLVLILDGFDEISTDKLDSAAKKINLFSQTKEYKSITILVTSRTNFFNNQLDSFQTFYLRNINEFDVENFLVKVLGDKKEEFYKLISRKNLRPLLFNFFTLFELSNLYRVSGTGNFPNNRKDIFEQIILRKIKSNEAHFRLSGQQLEEKAHLIISKLEQLAIAMTQLGKDNITKEIFDKIFPNINDRGLLKYGFLISKDATGTSWEFEHKNYKEYFAASILARQETEKVKELIAFKPKYEKIKPRWVNTISFLFSMLSKTDPKFEEILQWIIEIEPEVILKFEQESVPSKLKLDILKRIFDYYEVRNMIFPESLNFEDIARFCGDENSIIDFLSIELQKSVSRNRILNVLYTLREWTYLFKFNGKIIAELQRLINSPTEAIIHEVAIEAYFNCEFSQTDIDYVILNCVNIKDHRLGPAYMRQLKKRGLAIAISIFS